MDNEYKYYAFISYKHKENAPWARHDHAWAETIHEYLTKWKIPNAIDPYKLIKENDKQIKPVFRDQVEMYGGENVSHILEKELNASKTLIVVCSKKMISDQLGKQEKAHADNNNDKAYIFEEIDYFTNRIKRPVILVWIDKEPFDKNSPSCLPPQFRNTDIKVIDANAYRSGFFPLVKRHTTAEIAASIFQTNMSAFWDIYKRQRQVMIAVVLGVLLVFAGVVSFLSVNNSRNRAYKCIAEANEYIQKGSRYEAMKLTKEAYESYKGANGISLLMRKCLNEKIPFKRYDCSVTYSNDGTFYTTISSDNKSVHIHDSNTDEIIESFIAQFVESTVISPDNNLIICETRIDSIRIYNRNEKKITGVIANENYNKVSINKSGTRICIYDELNFNGEIYDMSDLKKVCFRPTTIYTNIDSLGWRSVKHSFMATDSLFVLYGKEAILEGSASWVVRDTDKDKWACYVYNLNLKDTICGLKPQLFKKIVLPDDITNIAASDFSENIIVTTTSGIYIHSFKNGNYSVRSQGYSNIIIGNTVGYDSIYREMYPDKNEIKIKNIKFCRNGNYALLTDNNNVNHTFNLNHYESYTPHNGFGIFANPKTVDREEFNNRDAAIDIIDKNYIISFAPNSTTENIYIYDYNSRYKSFKPATGFVKPELAVYYKNYNDFCIVENSRNESGESKIKNKYVSFFYKSTPLCELSIDHFENHRDTIICSISKTLKYAVLRKKMRSDGANILWDIVNNAEICNLSDLLHDGSYISDYNPVFISEDKYLLLNCNHINSADSRQKTAYFIYDIPNKEINFRSHIFGKYEVLGHNKLIVSKEDTTRIIYDPGLQDTICNLGKDRYWIYEKNDKMLVIKKYADDNKPESNVLVNLESKEVLDIPDSIHVDVISPDGKYLAEFKRSNLWIYNVRQPDSLKIINASDWSTVHKLLFNSNKKGNYEDFICFTPDSRYLLCTTGKHRGLVLYDVKNKREAWTLDTYYDIQKCSSSIGYLPTPNTYFGFAVSGKYIAIHSNNILLIDIETGKVKGEIPYSTMTKGTASGWQFTPDGKFLLAGNHLIDIENMKCIDSEMPESPVFVKDDVIIYRNFVYPLLNDKQMYQAIVRMLGNYPEK